MTGAAIRSKLASMPIILGMAGTTGGWSARKLTICMAIGACNICVSPGEREAGERVVERRWFPSRGAMAGTAIGAKLTAMLIILGMAGSTGGAHLQGGCTPMTLLAVERNVCPIQGETSLCVVEADLIPTIGVVAEAAIGTIHIAMWVVGEVAGSAVHGCADVLAILVAGFTGHIDMTTG